MGNKVGWISVHRCLLDNWLWDKKPFAEGQAWIDLLLLANHEDKKVLHQGQMVTFKRGTVNRSILSLADRWGWDRRKVRKFLMVLESEQMCTTNVTTHGTTITIVNYEAYQDIRDNKKNNNVYNRCTTDVQPFPTNNNDNNDNNDNKRDRDKSPRSFKPPTLEEVKAYCEERKNNIDPQQFIDFYTSKGWMVGKNKMKDWKAAVRTWEQRIFEFKAKDSKRQCEFEQNTNYAELESKLLEN